MRYLHELPHSEVAEAIKVRGRFVFNLIKKKKEKDCEPYHRGVTLASVRSYHLAERHSIRLPLDEKCRRLNVTAGKGHLLR